ncbi:MAG TPA: hypothetical protein VGR70_08110 [Stellaceae bacterium]|nr:hypothetical protein [Stellaceae bacterium]
MRIAVAIAALVSGLIAVASARGDIPPAPGEQERGLLILIERANHPCGKVDSYRETSGSDVDAYISQGLEPFIVTCTSGKTFLVAVPKRRPGPPLLDPSGKPVPYPDPVVKEISR